MMKIIDFLMNNIFILVIVFGALASLFGKAGSKKKPSQMPDFGGGGLPRMQNPQNSGREVRQERPQHERAEAQPVYQAAPEQKVKQRESVPVRERNDAAASQTSALERPAQRAAAVKAKTPDALESPSAKRGALAASLQEDDLRKAVIWAEVLGPPRSKRPYRR